MTTSGGIRYFVTGLALIALAGCGSQSADRAAVEIKGTAPSSSAGSAATAATPAPVRRSGGGIVSYDGYEAAVARSGDTVASVADRIGLSAAELGAYNGLQPNHPLREGDELVLPPRPGGYGAAPAPQSAAEVQPFQPSLPAQDPGGAGQIELAPLSSGDPSGLPPAAPAPAAPAESTGGWSPDLAAAAIERSTGIDDQGKLALPPSSAQPLPPDPQPVGTLASPQLSQYQTPGVAPGPEPTPRPVEEIAPTAEQVVEPEPAPQATELAAAAPAIEPEPVPQPAPQSQPLAVQPAPAPEPAPAAATPAWRGELRLIRPVQGPIVIGFREGGRVGNDGVDFASPANSPVVAAADGEVALVSRSLGGLGNIVLVRHPGDYLTVYGRIDRVEVQKGDLLRQGQRIGVVAATSRPRMHFEVRQGAESLDPEQFF